MNTNIEYATANTDMIYLNTHRMYITALSCVQSPNSGHHHHISQYSCEAMLRYNGFVLIPLKQFIGSNSFEFSIWSH